MDYSKVFLSLAFLLHCGLMVGSERTKTEQPKDIGPARAGYGPARGKEILAVVCAGYCATDMVILKKPKLSDITQITGSESPGCYRGSLPGGKQIVASRLGVGFVAYVLIRKSGGHMKVPVGDPKKYFLYMEQAYRTRQGSTDRKERGRAAQKKYANQELLGLLD